MNFLKKTWKDRISEYPNRRRLTVTDSTNVYTVSREEGVVTEQGDSFSAANMNDLEDRIYNAFSSGIDQIYPVGAIYMSVNDVNPSTLFGGTWERWGNGRVPVGVDEGDADFSAAEKIGGEKTHKLTIDELARHAHYTSVYTGGGTATNFAGTGGSDIWANSDTGVTGGDVPHNNLQPYITCYMWRRTA